MRQPETDNVGISRCNKHKISRGGDWISGLEQVSFGQVVIWEGFSGSCWTLISGPLPLVQFLGEHNVLERGFNELEQRCTAVTLTTLGHRDPYASTTQHITLPGLGTPFSGHRACWKNKLLALMNQVVLEHTATFVYVLFKAVAVIL